MEIVERAVEVNAPLESVFELLSDFENYPLWMRAVGDVRRTGRGSARWRAEAADGRPLEWETETVVFEPDRRIVWRSVGGDVDADGEVVLSETEYGTTLVRLVLGYAAPHASATRLLGRHPARQLDEDLARFAHVAERRARDLRTPRYERARHEERRREADTRGRQHERGRDHERDERGSRLADSRGVVWGDARGRRDEGRIEGRRHEEALRDAHRRQADDLRRYRDDRDRDRREHLREGHDAGEWHDEEARHRLRLEERARRAEALERWRAEERPRGRDETRRTFAGNEHDERGARAREDGAREYRPRYALTPRERGQFVGGPGRDDFERMSRRGVERLLDDDRPGRRRDDRDD